MSNKTLQGDSLGQSWDINFQPPVPSVSIENLVRMRASALERIENALRLLREAQEICDTAHLGFPRFEIYGPTRAAMLNSDDLIRQTVDREGWKYLMSESGLRTFMDAAAREEWDAQVYCGVVPALTLETIEATFARLYNTRRDMFERGVIQCFEGLCKGYRTNEPVKFGKRIIIDDLQIDGRFNHRKTDVLADLVRVFHVLEGKPEPDHRHDIRDQLQRANNQGQSMCFTEYLEVSWFKKGTGHVTFRKLELLDKLNAILAMHYPFALASEGRRAKAS